MASVNKVILVGNLGRDPEVRFTPNGQAVANFTLATTDTWNDKQSGNKQERTEWHRIVVWGKLAELCGEYLKKGRQTYVEGRLQTREWQDKENQKRTTTEVVANQVVFLGGRGEGGGTGGFGGGGKSTPSTPAGEPGGNDFGDPGPGNDDIPF